MFTALRNRLMNHLSPRAGRDRTSPRTQQQSPLLTHSTIGGRILKLDGTKGVMRSRINAEHLMSEALSSRSTSNSDEAIHSDGDGSNPDFLLVKEEDGSSGLEEGYERFNETTARSFSTPTNPRLNSNVGRMNLSGMPSKRATLANNSGHLSRNITTPELESNSNISPTESNASKLTRQEQLTQTLQLGIEGENSRPAVSPKTRPGWTRDEIDLFNVLQTRGFEPLMPSSWRLDFQTVPNILFSENDDEIFIKSLCGKDFRASRALSKLLAVGARARDRLLRNLAPEPTLTREIQAYIKWSNEDGGIDKRQAIPALVLVSAQGDETVASTIGRCQTELHALGERYRKEFSNGNAMENDGDEDEDELSGPGVTKTKGWTVDKCKERSKSEPKSSPVQTAGIAPKCGSYLATTSFDSDADSFDPPLPTLYGIAITYTIVAIVTYDSNQRGKDVRSLALFDFGDIDQDVWNAFGVAMVIVWARNYVVRCRWERKTEEEEVVDPDV